MKEKICSKQNDFYSKFWKQLEESMRVTGGIHNSKVRIIIENWYKSHLVYDIKINRCECINVEQTSRHVSNKMSKHQNKT